MSEKTHKRVARKQPASLLEVKYPQQSWGLDFVSPSKGQKNLVRLKATTPALLR